VLEKRFHGEFWKPCPGTGAGYYCCGYQILSPLTGCGMYCTYCVLQAYLDREEQVVFRNFDDLRDEVHAKMARRNGIVRVGTGELGDSLFLERRLGFCRRIAALLEPYDTVLLELKTKWADVELLRQIRVPGKVVIGFSMNTPAMIECLEHGTATLEQRLEAMRRCEEMGFRVAVHFDPMVWYPRWEEEYRMVVARVFQSIQDPECIAWWSLGGFRCVPALKARLKRQGLHLPLFSGELGLGKDGKYRYFRPVRVAFYRLMREEVERYRAETTLYLCMESPEVWRDSGLEERIPDGLPALLDNRASDILANRPS
jgi:spore photoproduct lyase